MKYLELYETLRGEIVGGAWAYGARLPSRRQISAERGLSVVTVEHSLELLCQEGYVEARPRSGYYVIYRDSDGFESTVGSTVHIAEGISKMGSAVHMPEGTSPMGSAVHIAEGTSPMGSAVHIAEGTLQMGSAVHMPEGTSPMGSAVHIAEGASQMGSAVHIAEGMSKMGSAVHMPDRVSPMGSAVHMPRAGRGEAFPFSVMARVMRRVLSEQGERIMEKSPNPGCAALREAIARYLARNRGMRVEVQQIVIGSGAEYLYGLVVEMLGNGRVYAMEYPSYAKIEQVYRARGVAVEPLPLGRDGILSAALTEARASVLHITPFRSYPTGVTASASKRREYLRWAAAGDRFIVEDDFESEFSLLRKPEDTVFSLSEGENVIYLNTFSRTVSPSLRVGYMVLPRRLVDVFEERVGFYSCTVPAFEQYVLAGLLDGGDFERHVNRIRRRRREQ